MSPKNRQALEYLEVRGYYTTGYTKIVQPERIFAVTDYFRRYWVPLLKPGPAWLVVALRQRCYWNGQRDWCTVSRETLAQESGVAIRTADNYLDLPLVAWFVTGRQARYSRTRDGAKRRDWTHYDLRLDEPLTPAHQAALMALAVEMAGSSQAGDPAARALDIVQQLLDLPAEKLLSQLEKTTDPAPTAPGVPLPCGSGTDAVLNDGLRVGDLDANVVARPQTILEIIESAAGAGSKIEPSPALASACDTLYTRIVRPDKVQIASQYFRLRWLPLLGAARAWLILHLRARCYLNTQELEVRDMCEVDGLAELVAALGVSISTVKTCLAELPAGTFFTHMATRRPAAGRVVMSFRVEMIDPLTPADRQRHAEMAAQTGEDDDDQQPYLAGRSPNQQSDFAESPSDQQTDFAGSSPVQQSESAVTFLDQKEDFAPMTNQPPDFATSPSGQQPDPADIDGPTNGQDLHNTKTLLITSEDMKTYQQKVLIPPGKESQSLAAAAGPVDVILTNLQIREPVLGRIQALNLPASVVLAWALEALSSEGIENKPAFLASMLQSGKTPPPDLKLLVRLTVGDWFVLVKAARSLRTTGRVDLPSHLAPHFEALYARFGRLDPAHWPIQLPVSAEDSEKEEEEPGVPLGDAEAEPAERESRTENQESIWSSVLADLRTQMDPTTFDVWLKGSRVARVEGNRWTVAVRSQTAADWLRHRLSEVICRTAGRIAGEPIEIEFEVAKT
jgi:hypothetical protein